MKIIKKAVTSRTRSPMMANHQSVNVKIFLSYPKRTKKRKRKKFSLPNPNRYSLSTLQSDPESGLATDSHPNQADPYSMENLLDETDPFSQSASATPSSTTSFPASFSTLQPANEAKTTGNMNWPNLLSEMDNDTGTLGMNAAEEDPLLNPGEKKLKAKSRRTQPTQLSETANQSNTPMLEHPTLFHSEEQLGIPVTVTSLPIMQMDTSTMTACSYYVILHGRGSNHSQNHVKLTIRLEVSPDGKNYAIQEEKELKPKEMLVLTPRHVARFTRLYVMDQTGGKKKGLEEEPLPPAHIDVYFQYRTSPS